MIYTVTVFEKISTTDQDSLGIFSYPFPDLGCIQAMGYFTDLTKALIAVRNAKNQFFGTTYNYCVIEAYEPGFDQYVTERYFFKWRGTRFVDIDEPKELNTVGNFVFTC